MIESSINDNIPAKNIEELLLLVGDKDRGFRKAAIDSLLHMGVAQVFPAIESAVRNDDDADLRNGAMEVLVAMGREILPQLLTLLNDENEEVRNFTTVMLGEIGNREAVPALIEALRDTDANVRHGAAEALGKIGDHGAFAPLMALLKEDFWLQYPAIAALGEMRDKRAVPQLLTLLENELLIQPAIEALGKIGDKRAISTVCSVLANHADWQIAGSAAQSIVAICEELNAFAEPDDAYTQFQELQLQHVIDERGLGKLKHLLQEGDRKAVSAAITLLGWLKEASVLPEFVRMLELDEYQAELEEAILCFGRPAAPLLVHSLSTGDENVKRVAVRLLGRLGQGGELKSLAVHLSDPDRLVQKEVLSALSGYEDHELVPDLIRLVSFGDEEISYCASELLGRFPYCLFQDFLQELVFSVDPEFRKRGAILIGHGSPEIPAGILTPLVKDADAAVRKAAAQSLGIRKESNSIKLLVNLLHDHCEDVRAEAVLSLAEFGKHVPVMELLGTLETAPEHLAGAIVKTIGGTRSEHAGQVLLQYLYGENVSQRNKMITISTLGKLGYQEATPALQNIYRSHVNPDVRRLAIEALASILDPLACETIQAACSDTHWSVRITALHSLLKFNCTEAISLLTAALADPDLMVRKNSAIALGETGDRQAVPPLVEHLVDHETGRYAFAALSAIGRKGLPVIHRMLVEGQPDELKIRLIDVVGRIGDRRSVKYLMDVLNDPSPPLKLAAIDALIFCFDGALLKKLSHLKSSDKDIQVKERADLALRALTTERFF